MRTPSCLRDRVDEFFSQGQILIPVSVLLERHATTNSLSWSSFPGVVSLVPAQVDVSTADEMSSAAGCNLSSGSKILPPSSSSLATGIGYGNSAQYPIHFSPFWIICHQ